MRKLGGASSALLVGAVALLLADRSSAGGATLKVSLEPLNNGRLGPGLFGNFIELLDDLVPGMRSEMLNDRGFEGVLPRSGWVFATGELNFCDREWQGLWTPDTEEPWNGSRCAHIEGRLDGSDTGHPGSVYQRDFAVRGGREYLFSGYLRADHESADADVGLRALAPDERWENLASAHVGGIGREWNRFEAKLTSRGTSEHAIFELSATSRVWVDQLSLRPADHRDGWRPDVVDTVAKLNPGIIRWGGSVCDPGGYRWKDGIGDRDARAPFKNAVWGRIDSNEVGILEFCRFCELVRAEPLVCVSFADGPESAAELVEYLNGPASSPWGAKRAANGHAEPYGVRYWQLGNELGDAAYVKGLPAFCAAVKKADPRAVLLTSFPSPELLATVGKNVGLICPHHYTPDLAACAADLDRLAAEIKKTPGCERVKIGVTEWNVTGGDWGLGRERLKTLGTALENARYLNILVRRCDVVELACRSNLANSLGSGVFETRPSGVLLRPSYHVMKLYADHRKPIPLAIAGMPDGVDATACRTENAKSLGLFLVNLRREPVEVSVELPAGFAPVSMETVADTLDGRQPDVMNHWDSPDRVRALERKVSGSTLVLPALSVSAVECAAR
jgi:alpha-N-arabinofuranosidase